MKKWLIFAALLITTIGGYVGAAHLSGGAFPTPGLALGGERGLLRSTTLSFIEDLRFKDFAKAASYHAPDEVDSVDIPFLLERMFLIKPEALEIMDAEIVFAEIDAGGNRARVKARVNIRDLGHQKIREQEFILYYHRESQAQPWYMKLESSLRKPTATDGKAH